MLLGGVLTAGIACPLWFLVATRELRDFGRRRDDMPFPFIVARPWLALLGWVATIAITAYTVVALVLTDADHDWSFAVSAVSYLLSALAPALLTTWSLTRRIAFARVLAGRDPGRGPSWQLACALALVPPLACAYLQRWLNDVWQPWAELDASTRAATPASTSDATSAPAPAPVAPAPVDATPGHPHVPVPPSAAAHVPDAPTPGGSS